MNNRNTLMLSLAIVAAMVAASLAVWFQLPPGAMVPIHWNADGIANRYAPASYGVFMAPAMAALITLVFAVIPWLEPRRGNLERSRKFFHVVWIGTILLMAAIHGMALYSTLHAGAPFGNLIEAAVSLLLIVIGNYLGKTRSMFLGGVRTPWTLSSEYSWQRTHSLAGKLFIAVGAIGFAAAFGLPTEEGMRLFVGLLIAAAALSVGMSYVFWLRDPARHGSEAR
ncbi:MAG: SdpI family protein [Proteobacteria bacterium]|nr:SdpI family protein [Pseudomonadota bacterium]